MNDLIQLQTAHATQTGGERSPWKVEANITNEPLHALPSSFSEAQVFAALAFARKFEQVAFEAGIAFQKNLSRKLYEKRIEDLVHINEQATAENERLAAKLMTLIGERE